jgi:FtsH-binding integral membrane protein
MQLLISIAQKLWKYKLCQDGQRLVRAIRSQTFQAYAYFILHSGIRSSFNLARGISMANPLSTLGIIHTVISVVPVVAGLYGFSKYRAILPKTDSGRIYVITLILSALTSFGLSSTGGFNAGHAIGIMAILAVAFSLIISRLGWFGRLNRYLQALSMSFTFFLLLVPGINETLSRVPPSNPIGNGPDSSPVQTVTAIWAVIFLIGICLQAWTMHRRSGASALPA